MSTVTGFRISAQQAAWWRESQTHGHGPFAACLVLQLAAPVQEQQLEARLHQLTQAEEILRTRLTCLPGMSLPMQVIEGATVLPLLQEDLRGLSSAERAIHLAEWRAAPLIASPLEVTLAKSGDGDLLLLKASTGYLD